MVGCAECPIASKPTQMGGTSRSDPKALYANREGGAKEEHVFTFIHQGVSWMMNSRYAGRSETAPDTNLPINIHVARRTKVGMVRVARASIVVTKVGGAATIAEMVIT